jgi:hypothetical protein
MGKYLAAAFTNRWNLLAFFAGIGAAAISGYPEIAVPAVLGAEAAYLGVVSSIPSFRNYVNVHQAAAKRRKRAGENEKVMRRILRELPGELRDRYEELRRQCLELRDIAGDLRMPGRVEEESPLETLHLEGYDRLLWTYLRLLYTQHALARFLDDSQIDLVHKDIERLENRLRDLDAGAEQAQAAKIRATLEDDLATCRKRLANYQKARSDHELVQLETDRLANKVKSMAEESIRPPTPDWLSTELGAMTSGLVETEKTMDELEFATGIGHLSSEPPEMLESTRVVQENRFG